MVRRLGAAMPEHVTFLRGGAPHIQSLSLPGYRSEVLMNFLEARDIYTSKSSACKKGGRSHVLEALGLPAKVIDGALRISFSRYTTEAEGIYVSKSSACKKGGRSHVLEAMDVDPRTIDASIRIGLSRLTTDEDITALCEGICAAWSSLAHF